MTRRLDAPIDLPPEVTETPEGVRYLWAQRNVPAMVDEPHAPWSARLVPEVSVRVAAWQEDGRAVVAPRDARELSAALFRAYEPGRAPDEALRAEVARILAAVPDEPAAKARALHAFVRDTVRYCAIEIGIGGWIAHPAPKVLGQRYGDCKDKANLLQAMLGVAGVPSRVATIFAHDGFPLKFGLPTVSGNANHMILLVDLPTGTVACDPTSDLTPFGELPPGDQDADVLPFCEAGCDVVHLPLAPAATNAFELLGALRIAADGSAQGTFRATGRGVFAGNLRARLRGSSQTALLAAAPWVPLAGDVTVRAVNGREIGTGTPAASVEGAVNMPRAASRAADLLVLRPDALLSTGIPSFSGRSRELPFVLGALRDEHAVVRIALPAGFVLRELPAVTVVACPAGTYRAEWRRDGEYLVYERRWTTSRSVLSPEDVHAARTALAPAIAEATRPVTLARAEAP